MSTANTSPFKRGFWIGSCTCIALEQFSHQLSFRLQKRKTKDYTITMYQQNDLWITLCGSDTEYFRKLIIYNNILPELAENIIRFWIKPTTPLFQLLEGFVGWAGLPSITF